MNAAHPLFARPSIRLRRSTLTLSMWAISLGLAGIGSACDIATSEAPGPVAAAPAAASAPSAAAEVDPASESDSRPGAEDPGLSGPPTGLTPPADGEQTFTGTVAARLKAGGYSYLWIARDGGEPRWVVTMARDVLEGARVEVSNFGSREDFYSRRLDRRFSDLIFGMVRVIG